MTQYDITVERRFIEIAEAENTAFKLVHRALYCGVDRDLVAPLYGAIRRLSFCENPSLNMLVAARKMLRELSNLANPHL